MCNIKNTALINSTGHNQATYNETQSVKSKPNQLEKGLSSQQLLKANDGSEPYHTETIMITYEWVKLIIYQALVNSSWKLNEPTPAANATEREVRDGDDAAFLFTLSTLCIY